MVAYSFQRRFCDDVAAGRKTQTIRGRRKRHAQPGEPIQLFFGMRTKHCRKLVTPDPICLCVEPIEIWVPDRDLVFLVHSIGRPVHDEFAQADGFKNAKDFSDFWRRAHGAGTFHGVLIKWRSPTQLKEAA